MLLLYFRTQTVEVARAEAEKTKKIGAAEAYSIEVVGKAEAERMRAKAAVYKQYGDAAIMSIVLEALPKVNPCLSSLPLGLNVAITLNISNDALPLFLCSLDCSRSCCAIGKDR